MPDAKGPPSLSRDDIRALAPCPECGVAAGELCRPGRQRNHHGRMQAAQRAWSERAEGNGPVLIEDDYE